MQYIRDADSLLGQSLCGCSVYIAPCRVRRAIRSIRPHGKKRNIFQPADSGGGAQRQFLIPSAFPLASQIDDRFSAQNIGLRLLILRMVSGNRCKKASGFLRHTGQAVRQHMRFIP